MNSKEILTKALQIIKNDSALISDKQGEIFWQACFSGLSSKEQWQFGQFANLASIEDAKIRKNVTDNDIAQLFADYEEFKSDLDPNKMNYRITIGAAQMAFIMIINRAIKLYNL